MANSIEERKAPDSDQNDRIPQTEDKSERLSFHSVMSDAEPSSPENDGRAESSKALPNIELLAFADSRDTQRKPQENYEKNKTEKEKLTELSEKLIADPASRQMFKADLETIERNVQQGKLSRAEADATLKEVHRLMSTESSVGVSQQNRVILGRQIVKNTADPSGADQGAYDNCNVAAPEVRLYHRSPSSVAKLVADAALTGKYTATNKQTVDITRSVQPADEKHLKVPAGENERSYASQLFHLVSINLSMQDKFPGKNFEYVQQKATPTDGGARVLDLSQNPPKEVYEIGADGKASYQATRVKDEKGRAALDAGLQPVMTSPMGNPGLSLVDSFNTIEKVSGKKEIGSCISHFEQGGYATNWILDKVGLSGHARRDGRIPFFYNESDLKTVLDDAKKNNLFPVLLQVNTGSGFLGKQVEQASGKPLGGEGAGFGGGHVLCLKDYDPATGKIGVDNTWGSSRDKLGSNSVSLKEIVTISQTDARLAARAQEFSNHVQGAYKYWCRENKKTPGVHHPSEAVGKVWLERYKRELQKAIENSQTDYPAFFY